MSEYKGRPSRPERGGVTAFPVGRAAARQPIEHLTIAHVRSGCGRFDDIAPDEAARLVLVDGVLRDASGLAAALVIRGELNVVSAGTGLDFGEAAAAALLPLLGHSKAQSRLELFSADAAIPGVGELLACIPRVQLSLHSARSSTDLAFAAELRDVIKACSDPADAQERTAAWLRLRAPLTLNCHAVEHAMVVDRTGRRITPATVLTLHDQHTRLVILCRTVEGRLTPEVVGSALIELAKRGRRPTVVAAGEGVDRRDIDLMTVVAAHGAVLGPCGRDGVKALDRHEWPTEIRQDASPPETPETSGGPTRRRPRWPDGPLVGL